MSCFAMRECRSFMPAFQASYSDSDSVPDSDSDDDSGEMAARIAIPALVSCCIDVERFRGRAAIKKLANPAQRNPCLARDRVVTAAAAAAAVRWQPGPLRSCRLWRPSKESGAGGGGGGPSLGLLLIGNCH